MIQAWSAALSYWNDNMNEIKKLEHYTEHPDVPEAPLYPFVKRQDIITMIPSKAKKSTATLM